MGSADRVRLAVAVLLVSALGCLDSGSDSGSSVGGGGSTPQGILDDIATGVASAAVDATVGILQGIIEWTSPGFGAGREETIVWNEVEQAWTWIDSIQDSWAWLDEAPKPYAAGTWGPTAAIALLARDDREWEE